MLVNLLALTACSLVPSQNPNFGYSAEVTLQAQKRDCYSFNGEDYTLDNRFIFYCRLDFDSTNSYALFFKGFDWSVTTYEYRDSDLLQTKTLSYYYQNEIQLDSYSTFTIDTNFNTGGPYQFQFTVDSLETLNFSQVIMVDGEYADEVFREEILCIWIPFFEREVPYIIDGNSYQRGYDEGVIVGAQSGDKSGYNKGYNDGYTDAQADGGVPAIIFGGILNIALIPVNFFLAILNFEVFGINIGGFVTGLMTLAVIFILFGIIFGGRASPNGGPSGGGKK